MKNFHKEGYMKLSMNYKLDRCHKRKPGLWHTKCDSQTLHGQEILKSLGKREKKTQKWSQQKIQYSPGTEEKKNLKKKIANKTDLSEKSRMAWRNI